MTFKPEPVSANSPAADVLRFDAAQFSTEDQQPDMTTLWTKTLSMSSTSMSPSPSISNNGSVIFYTADWGAARSTDGGTTWTYLDPSSYQGSLQFCCQQDTVFDPVSGQFIWLMTMSFGNGTTTNGYRIGSSTDLINWTFVTISISQMSFSRAVYYAVSTQIQLTAGNLWVSANLGNGFEVVFSFLMKV